MGRWFSNISVRKNGVITADSVADYIVRRMTVQQYVPAPSEDEADGTTVIVSGTEWISIYSDLLPADAPREFSGFAVPMSAELHTDVLGISCFDSDYLCLNLIDAEGKVDAWAGIGSAAGLGIRRRTNLSAWKNKVSDYPGFKNAVQRKYDLAEEALDELSRCLGMSVAQSSASCETLEQLRPDGVAMYLYFKLPEQLKSGKPTRFELYMYSYMPCFLKKPSVVDWINVGAGSRGLSVYLTGPYVEHEEITFSHVSFIVHNDQVLPIELKKIQLPDGQWAYCHHAPELKIPPKVDERLPDLKRQQVEHERCIAVRFIPHGDPRKILDVSVTLVPDQNPAGRAEWNVWKPFGSKAAFVEHHNNTWLRYSDCGHLMLREEDFD